jgi:thymidylate synthase (FAD)
MPKVEIKFHRSTSNPDETAVIAARGDYMSESLIGDDAEAHAIDTMTTNGDTKEEKLSKFIRKAISRGHWGIFEHPTAFFAIEGVSRDMMAQITRHRHMSFDVQSMRYVDFDDAEFSVPESAESNSVTTPPHMGSDMSSVQKSDTVNSADVMEIQYQQCLDTYNKLVDGGMDKEQARKVLPIGTKVNMTMSANLRSLMHLFDLRVSGAAQDDTISLARKIKNETEKWAPLTMKQYNKLNVNKSLNSP